MKTYIGDIWNLHKSGYNVVIPINIGWTKAGTNVMGKGLAAEAKDRFPELPTMCGYYSRMYGSMLAPFVHQARRVILFPTKPLNVEIPSLSWKGNSTIEQVENSLKMLAIALETGAVQWQLPVAIPLVGAGNGKLDKKLVYNLICTHLGKFENVCVVFRDADESNAALG